MTSLPHTAQDTSLDELATIVAYLQRHMLQRMTKLASKSGISIPQFTLLSYLHTTGETTMGQLAVFMGHTTPATTGLVDRLSQAGYVERHHARDDRRKVFVSITRKGEQMLLSCREELLGRLDIIRLRLSEEDQKAWLRIYRVVRDFCCELDSKPE